jgi:hypothetical protein
VRSVARRLQSIGAMRCCLALVVLGGCLSEDAWDDDPPRDPFVCPSGETCSTKTPNGLEFRAVELFDLAQAQAFDDLLPTALGGTQELALHYRLESGPTRPLDLAFAFDSRGLELVEADGATITIRGVIESLGFARIVDPDGSTLFDRRLAPVAPIQRIVVLPTNEDDYGNRRYTERPIVYASDVPALGVMLFGTFGEHGEQRLVDASMELELAGSIRTAWDTLELTTTGPSTRTLTGRAGDVSISHVIELVDRADTIELDPGFGSEISLAVQAIRCFIPMSGDRPIAGVADITITTDNGSVSEMGSQGCVYVEPATTGTVRLTVSALGATHVHAIPVVP